MTWRFWRRKPSVSPDSPFADDVHETLKRAKFYATTSRANLVFRFGPYTGPEVGQIMTRCAAEKIPLVVTAECGAAFDWTLVADLHKPTGENKK